MIDDDDTPEASEIYDCLKIQYEAFKHKANVYQGRNSIAHLSRKRNDCLNRKRSGADAALLVLLLGSTLYPS